MKTKETTLTITSSNGKTGTLTGSVLNNMIYSQVKKYEDMIQFQLNRPGLTKEERMPKVESLRSKIEELQSLIGMTYSL